MKPSSLNDVRNMYEASADSFSTMMDKEIDLPVYQDMLGRLHENISNTPGALLDIACGSGDMRSLPSIDKGSVAGIIIFFAIHHLDLDRLSTTMLKWNRVLVQKGHLLLAAWEGVRIPGTGVNIIGINNIVALRYSSNELSEVAEQAGLIVTRCTVKPVEDFPMDAIYLECLKE